MAKSRKSAKDTPEKADDAVVVDDSGSHDPETATDDVPAEASDQGASDDAQPEGDVSQPVSQEDTPDAEPEAAEKAVAPASQPPAAGGGSSFLPLLLGGAVAAALGFGAARYPDQWPFVSQPAVDPVAVKLTDLDARLTGLEGLMDTQSTALSDLQNDTGLDRLRGELGGQIDQMRTQYAEMSAKLRDLENRIHTVEKLPQGSGMEAAAAAAAAYERELQQMRQMLDAELARISNAQDQAETLEVSAAEAAKAAAARAAMSRVLAALESGQPYGNALFDLTENAGVDAPSALAAHAETGIVTLATLQARFPDAARDALDASIRDAVSDGQMDRVTAFFRTQLGARSLEPKEGDDPDAVLSRAEAALKDGRIAAALTELEAMPEAGKPALEGWIADATARKDALEAGQTLAQQLNSN